MEKIGKSSYIILYALLMSHFGWAFEMLFFYFCFGIIADRGFITLPLCPIYGITLVVIYYLIGTPRKGGVLLSRIKCTGWRTLVYFTIATLIPTLAELFAGETMEKISGRVLWDYSEMTFNFGRYISLESSLTWGILIMFVMLWYDLIFNLLLRIPTSVARRISSVFIFAVTVDFSVNLFLLS